jgi:hypothetical protein
MGFLGTFLGTHLGTHLGRDMTPANELATLEAYLARNLFAWFEPDDVTESGGKTTSFLDKVALVSEGAVAPNARSVDSAHALTQSDPLLQVNPVTQSALISNRFVATFTAAQRYSSTIAAANWQFANDGSGYECWFVLVPKTAAETRFFFGTTASTSPGHFAWQANTVVQCAITNSGAYCVSPTTAGTLTIDVPTYLNFRHSTASTPDYSFNTKGTAPVTGTYAFGLVGNPPLSTFTLGDGRDTGSAIPSPSHMLFAGMLIANRLSATLRANVERYIALKWPALA